MSKTQPNILFIIWDACRYDYAVEHAPNLRELAENNIWFDKAITPAPWSPPAHASIFTGEYPHKHGMYQLNSSLGSVTLTGKLSAQEYTCYGVSANGFACQRTGFHTDFDEFYYSRGRERYPEALNVSGYALSQLENGTSKTKTGLRTVAAALKDEKRIKSLANIAAVGLGSLAVRWQPMQRIPHSLFVSDSAYNYRPETNTERLKKIIRDEESSDAPFFAFANYMDTHRPYNPCTEKQQKHLGRELSTSEVQRINDNVAEPWQFAKAEANDDIDDDDIEVVRKLYAGEVETVDDHLGELLNTLRETNQLDETLVVVTSDHGENLGEIDEMGLRRMGHESSISNALARVPLVVAHPEIDQKTVSVPYSLTNLYQLFINSGAACQESSIFIPEDNSAVCQYPATGGKELFAKYPEVPRDILNHKIKEHSVSVYQDEWRVVMETTGDKWAFENGDEYPIDKAPENIRELCQEHFDVLQSKTKKKKGIDERQQSQLEALGYM